MYQSGYLAMVRAVETYSPERGMKFIGWLAMYLKTAFNEALGVRRRDPIHGAVSLDLPLGEGVGDTPGDLIPDPDGQSLFLKDEERVWMEHHTALKVALDTLPEPQRDILYQRFWGNRALTTSAGRSGWTPQGNGKPFTAGIEKREPPCVGSSRSAYVALV